MGRAGAWSTERQALGTYVARACAAQQRDYHIIGASASEGNMHMRNWREELIGQLILVREQLP